MSILSRPIPGLFGGVSQQFPAMRHPTQGEAQDNALSTVVDGLYKRPGTTHVGFTGLSWPSGSPLPAGNAFIHVVDRGPGSMWGVLLDGQTAKVVNMETGASEAVTVLSGAAYLTAANPKGSFRCITVADTTFIVNTGATVLAAANDIYVVDPKVAFVYVKVAAAQQTHYITINGTSATFAGGATPTVATVTAGLQSAVNALGGKTATLVAGTTGLIKIVSTTDMVITVSDTFGNSTLSCVSNGVSKFSDLPPEYEAGVRVKITGSGPNVDPYWVSWSGTQWVETRTPGVSTGFTAATMPHKLTRTGGGGTWEFQQVTWTERLVGDDDTNPQPSFVGQTLRDIFFYRNRLGFLSSDTLAMSRAGKYFNFFAATATEVLDTDPIDLGGTSESIDTLDWAVPFNKELVIWATSRQQFSLATGEVLSPKSARLVATTAFESNASARPRQMGNRIVYPSTVKGKTQLGLYRVSQDTVSNTMESITDHVPTYIPNDPLSIDVSEAFKVATVLPPESNELYVFKYEDDGEKMSQRAWQKFTFGCNKILKAHWSNSRLYLFCYYEGSSSPAGLDTSAVALEVVDFDTSVLDTGSSVAVRLDRKSIPTVLPDTPVVGQTQVTLPYRMLGTPTVLQSLAGYTREFKVVSSTPGETTTTIVVHGTWSGGSVMVGNKYTMRYTFSEIFLRDADGVPVMSTSLKVLKVLVHYIGTGFFKTTVTTKALGSYSYPFIGEGVGFGLGLGNAPTLSTGNFSIPVQAKSTGTVISVESDSFLPCRFPYAEWVGSVTMKAKR
jgi:hypothetical protein